MISIKTPYGIELNDPLKDIQIEEGEKYYVALFLSPYQTIYLTVKYYTNPIDQLNEPISDQYANEVISNLASILKNNYPKK